MSSPSAWSRSRRTVYRSVPAKLAAQVYEHCAATSPNASKFGVQAALLLGALKKVGLAISPDVRVMVDLRRYLGAGLIDGNFFAGVPMKIHSDMTPTEITTTTRRTKESGRPLLNQMLTSTRLGKPVPVPTERTPGELPQVTFSFLGAPPTVQMLPFVTGERPVYAASVEPAGPDGLTFVHGECAGQMILNACFHDNVIDADLMNEVLDLVVTDPLALLSEQR